MQLVNVVAVIPPLKRADNRNRKIMEITWDVIDSHAYQFRNIGVGADTDVVVLGDHSLQPSLRDVARLALQSIGASVVEVLSTSALNKTNGDRNIATELVSSSVASSDYVIDCTKSKLTQNLDLDSIQRSGTQVIIEDKNTWISIGEASK